MVVMCWFRGSISINLILFCVFLNDCACVLFSFLEFQIECFHFRSLATIVGVVSFPKRALRLSFKICLLRNRYVDNKFIFIFSNCTCTFLHSKFIVSGCG